MLILVKLQKIVYMQQSSLAQPEAGEMVSDTTFPELFHSWSSEPASSKVDLASTQQLSFDPH